MVGAAPSGTRTLGEDREAAWGEGGVGRMENWEGGGRKREREERLGRGKCGLERLRGNE